MTMDSSQIIFKSTALSLSLFIALGASHSFAESSEEGTNVIEEVVVTATKRQANIQDKLIKTFDECIRRTHILKQCEVALTLIGKSILMDNPELNISSSKQQKGGTIDDIADKIKTMKENEYQKTKGSIETNVGFDDTHPFTLLESMINYNDILNNLNRFFIAQYDGITLTPKSSI